MTIEFHERPGITYSMRRIHKKLKDRPLFGMIDVIDGDPKQRWLCVCFYGDMIEDPDELGDLIPEGLLGIEGYCFYLKEHADALGDYLRRRIQEVYKNACNKGY